MKPPTHPKLTLTASLLLLAACFAAVPAIAAEAAPGTPPPISGVDADLPAPDAAPEAAPGGDEIVEGLDSGALYQCIQITVWAQDPETGECHEFPNPCSVPDGWNRSFDPETCTNW